MEKLRKLKKIIEEIEITYNYEETYTELYNAIIDYQNDTQNWDFEYLFEDIITHDLAKEIVKNEIEQGGLIRLYYFLGDANLRSDIFRINDYRNLEDIKKDDLEYIKDEILSTIDEMLKNEE